MWRSLNTLVLLCVPLLLSVIVVKLKLQSSLNTHVTPIEKGIQFLYDKGVLADDRRIQEIEFSRLRFPETLSPKLQKHYKQCQARLLRLSEEEGEEGEIHSDHVPDNLHRYTKKEFPGYNNIAFLDDDNVRVQRHQLSGLCYMHAPAVVQYYNIWHHAIKQGTETDHKMLDLARVIRDTFSADKLYQHVFKDDVDSSSMFLKFILQPESIILPSVPDRFQDDLEQYGPGLVAQFEVHGDFFDSNVRHHHGKPSGKVEGMHAMVLIGARESEGKRYFLLQNW